MARYTIETDRIYALSILAAINEVLESSGKDNVDLESIYLTEAIESLVSELASHVERSNIIADEPEKWNRALHHIERLAKAIRDKVEN